MPKMKTNRGAAKRFKRNGSGGFKRAQSFRRHILTKKSPGRKRSLRKATVVSDSEVALVRAIILA